MHKTRKTLRKLFELAGTLRAAELINESKGSEALELLKDAASLLPKSALIAYDLGVVHTTRGEHAEAIAAYTRALSLNREFPEALNNLGAALLEKGNYEEAIAKYRRALSIRKEYSAALYNLGNALLQRRLMDKNSSDKDTDEAIYSYQKALQGDPKNPLFLYGLGRAHYLKGRVNSVEYDKAITAFQETLGAKDEANLAPEDKPSHADVYSNLGFAFYAESRFEDAVDALQKVVALKPDDPNTHYYLGSSYRMLEGYGDAINQFQTALKIKEAVGIRAEDEPKDADIFSNLGFAYCDNGLYEEAIAALLTAVTWKSDDANIHCYLGNAYSKLEQYAAAIDSYKRVLDLKPDDPDTLTYLGLAFYNYEQMDQAVEVFLKVSALRPGEEISRYLDGARQEQNQRRNVARIAKG